MEHFLQLAVEIFLYNQTTSNDYCKEAVNDLVWSGAKLNDIVSDGKEEPVGESALLLY